MAVRSTKLRQRILVRSAVVFILFWASSSSADRPRCYWCGPLAEQVHRSQRAPSCATFHTDPQQTECEPGYSHCAIVATSPPYAESRLCVKFYQDECYSLYCNSTKTWRMVCACQGDLCNGPHTQREKEAFALVPKFPKNKSRDKRSTNNVQPKTFIGVKTKSAGEENTIIVMGKEPNDTKMLNDQNIESSSNEQSEETKIGEGNTSLSDEDIKTDFTPTPKKDEDKYMIVHGALTNFDKNIDITKAESQDVSKKDVEPTVPIMKDKDTTTMTQAETTKEDMIRTNEHNVDRADVNIKTDNEHKLNVTEAPKDYENDKMDNHANNKEMNKDYTENKTNYTPMNKPEIVTMPTKSPEILKEIHNTITTIKPTIETSIEVQTSATAGKMPPAENLQQNTTPTKAMEITTMGTLATDSHVETTTHSAVHNDTKKNSGVKNSAHAMVLVICFVALYCV